MMGFIYRLKPRSMSTNHSSHPQWLLFDILKPFALFCLGSLLLFSLSRLALVIWLYPRVEAVHGLWFIFLQGLRFDLVMLGIALVVPLVLTPVLHLASSSARIWSRLVVIYLAICFGLFIFMEAATPSFINQYDLRPNIWFIEYLKYPHEVFSTLYKAYSMQLLAAILVTFAGASGIYRMLRKASSGAVVKWYVALPAVPLLFLVCVAMIRSTTDHRPVNPATVAFSNDPLMNTLPMSSAYTVLYAAIQLKNEQKSLRPYGDLAEQKVVEDVRRGMALPDAEFVSADLPTLHHHHATLRTAHKKNLVIILVESLGGEFVGKLGGLPLTPQLDQLAQQGIWFDHMYATGTRSVRGIEAVVSGYLPTIARSVVKLPRSQTHFFTIASALHDQGYSTSFIYGGEGQFDNMASFFTGNGFDKAVDQKDYENPVFLGSWGVSDEDLFAKADREFTESHKNGPFFSLVFTTSNHTPFEFPDGRIKLYEQPMYSRNNAVKYTDYAIGEFFRKARKSSYWDDTVFLVIADHNSRVFGSDLVPIQGFHIPALILGKDVAPRVVSRVASQIDMVPTLLSMIGVDALIPATGIDLTRPDIKNIPGRAVMQFSNNLAYMENDRVVILRPGQSAKFFTYLGDGKLASADKADPALLEKALANSIWPTMAYNKHLYRVIDMEQMKFKNIINLSENNP